MTLGLSMELPSVDFSVLLVRTAKVSGRVTSPDGTPFVIVQVAVRPDAPPGSRSLYLAREDERAVLTGSIEVVAP